MRATLPENAQPFVRATLSLWLVAPAIFSFDSALAQQPTWTNITPAPVPRTQHAMAYDAGRRVTVLFGGYNRGLLGDTWEWDGINWKMRNPTTSPPARSGHALAY